MLKYLIIQLDDVSPSFCHYNNNRKVRKLIAYEDLKDGIMLAMKENLMVQFVYPDYKLPDEYIELIDMIDHIDIKSNSKDTDILVFNGTNSLMSLKSGPIYAHIVLRLSKDDLFCSASDVEEVLKHQNSINIVITDIDFFKDEDFKKYIDILEKLSIPIVKRWESDKTVNLNLITDRLFLSSMNNCNAGDECITLAPDGQLYCCPAFYFDGYESIGNLVSGISISNAHLYKLSHAPICRNCDAYQCKRCLWLNKKTTLEINTPSHEQCVVAHIERNASAKLSRQLYELGMIKLEKVFPETTTRDPLYKLPRITLK